MNSSRFKKGAFLLAVFAVSTTILVSGLNFVNTAASRSVTAINGAVAVDSGFDGSLRIVRGITSSESDRLCFAVSSAGQPLSLLIDDLKFGHEIYIDGQLASQNIDAGANQYDGAYAYKTFDLSSRLADGNRVSIEVRGSLASQTKLFLAGADTMRSVVELRTICYSVMLMCLVMFTLASLVLYFNIKPSGLFLLFVVMGAVSIVKSVNLGEPCVLSKAISLTYRQFGQIDGATSAVNLVLPAFVMLRLFDLYPLGKWRWAAISSAALLTALTLVFGHQSRFYLVYAQSVYLVSVALSIYGCVQNKPFCGIVMLNNILYSSFTFFTTYVHSGVFSYGLLNFYVNMAYLGALIYLCIFLGVYIDYSFCELHKLEDQKKRYERLTLLRGISHDLKLPLSVIKMNNQMLEKYPLEERERMECIRMSVDAVRELEDMTANINSYLNLEDPERIDSGSSVKRSFNKMKEHYTVCSKGTGLNFTAVWQGEDRLFPVTELLLDRLMYNLVDNAFKYNRPGGKVSLTCRTDEKNTVIAVADTGIGMNPEELKRVFTPFYRSDQSRSREGLGLGLSVVQGVADSLGGKITVTSSPGEGTRVEVCIPVLP